MFVRVGVGGEGERKGPLTKGQQTIYICAAMYPKLTADGDAHHGVSHRVTLPVKLTRGKKGKPRRAKVGLGLGRIVALHHRSSTSYHIH